MLNPLAFIAGFAITFFALFALKPLAIKVNLMDYPGGRKDHSQATPLIGGLGIYLGILLPTLLIPDLFAVYAPLLAISLLVLLIGIRDDFKEMSVTIRMGTQILAASLMFTLASNPLTSVGNLIYTGPIALGILSLPITAFATVGVINATNMSDGIDGLCGGMVIITLMFLGLVNYQQDFLLQASFIALLSCSLLAYFVLNFRRPWKLPAMIYLGDAGSTFIGFVLAWLLIESTQGSNAAMPPVLALWFLSVPLIDTVTLLIKRPLEGRSPFDPGRDHLHHKLFARGFSKAKVMSLLFLIDIIIATIGLIAYKLGVGESNLFIGFMSLFTLYFVANILLYPQSKQASHD